MDSVTEITTAFSKYIKTLSVVVFLCTHLNFSPAAAKDTEVEVGVEAEEAVETEPVFDPEDPKEDFYFPPNGKLCKHCNDPDQPLIYYSILEDFFTKPTNLVTNRETIGKAIEDFIGSEITEIAFYTSRSENQTDAELKEYSDELTKMELKIEGLNVFLDFLEIHYGSWAKELAQNSLNSSKNLCLFDKKGLIVDWWRIESQSYDESKQAEDTDGNKLSCKQLTLTQILERLKKAKKSSEFLKEKLSTPSAIADQVALKTQCNLKTSSIPQRRVFSKTELETLFCGIMKSARIKESLNQGTQVYVGGEDSSYACKQVGLFFVKKEIGNKSVLTPEPYKSFVIHPDGRREDISNTDAEGILWSLQKLEGSQL